MDTRKEDAIKKIKQERCQYPEPDEETGEIKPCGKKQMMTVSLHIVHQTESGKLEGGGSKDESIQIPVPFCDYHSFIAMSGVFAVKTDVDMKESQLVGPFDMIHIAEAVVNSMAMTGKIQEIFETKEKTEKEIKEKKV